MKPYVKPELFYESFEMNQSIAACGWDMTNEKDKAECTADYDYDLDNNTPPIPMALFTETTTKTCSLLPKDAENYCYTNGVDAYRTLQS